MTKQFTFELRRGFTLDDHFVGTFHGHMRFTDAFGDTHIIKNDFSGLVKARKEDEQ